MMEERIIALEERFSHQDYLLGQLNKTVTDQQLVIHQLQKDIMALKLSQNANANQGTRSLSDDVPPHY